MVATDPPTVPTAEQCRVARLRLDGASNDFIIKRSALSADAITPAWEDCRRALSAALAPGDYANGIMLTNEGLQARVGECLSCLLDSEQQATRGVALDRTATDSSSSADVNEEE